MLGSTNAVITLVEFSDYECPYCLRHFQQTMPLIDANYVKTGKIRYAFRDWPVDELHPQSIRAHEAAHCANEQNKFWQMHTRLFAPAGSHSPEQLSTLAQSIGLDMSAFSACVAAKRSDHGDSRDGPARGGPGRDRHAGVLHRPLRWFHAQGVRADRSVRRATVRHLRAHIGRGAGRGEDPVGRPFRLRVKLRRTAIALATAVRAGVHAGAEAPAYGVFTSTDRPTPLAP